MRIRSRMVLGFLLLVAPALVVLDLLAQRIISGLVEERTLVRLESEARLLAGHLQEGDGLVPDPDPVADRAGEALGLRVTVIAPDGRVVGDSERSGDALRAMDNHRERPEVRAAMATGRGLSVRHSDTVKRDLHYLAVRVGSADHPAGIVRLAVPSDEVRALEKGASRHVVTGTFLVGGLVVVLGYVMARRTSSSIESVEGIARALATGDASTTPAPVGGSAEVEGITRSLQAVGERLREQVDALSQERNLLKTIVSGMHEGLLIVDGDERVVLANGLAVAAFPAAAGPLEGRLAVEVVRDPEFLDLVRGALREGSVGQERLTLFDGRILEIRVVPLEGPGLAARGALALVLDVTQMDRLEGVRRDFVANVSHELRTPLASIMAFVETLLDETPACAPHHEFLEIISRNSKRMEDLINDLTDLSLIETGAISLSLTDLDLSVAVAEAFDMVRAKADAHQVTLRSRIEPTARVFADPRRLSQVLINLVDNAVKFNRQGGSVVVASERRGAFEAISVTDEGPGIPPEHQENVFHRFYRVPGSTERTGTGLGLAIVKHLMRLQGGSIDLTASPGIGSTFRVLFPAADAARQSAPAQAVAVAPRDVS